MARDPNGKSDITKTEIKALNYCKNLYVAITVIDQHTCDGAYQRKTEEL